MTRKDAYRDYNSYPDQGCKLYPSCLNCPLPKCILDESGRIARAEKRTRDEKIRQRFKDGESTADLAKVFGVSQRIIQRAVRGG